MSDNRFFYEGVKQKHNYEKESQFTQPVSLYCYPKEQMFRYVLTIYYCFFGKSTFSKF